MVNYSPYGEILAMGILKRAPSLTAAYARRWSSSGFLAPTWLACVQGTVIFA
jgi:hypothetical protein